MGGGEWIIENPGQKVVLWSLLANNSNPTQTHLSEINRDTRAPSIRSVLLPDSGTTSIWHSNTTSVLSPFSHLILSA